MSNIIEIKKSIIIKYEEREKRLPEKLKEKIEKFWKNAIEKNPNLYNGLDYTIEEIEKNESYKNKLCTLLI